MHAQPLGGADRPASDPLGDLDRPDHRGPDGLTQNKSKYVSEEIDANAGELAMQIKAAEGG